MITPAQKEPDLAVAGLALIVIFGLLMWHDNPIRSDRPLDSSIMQPQYPHTTNYAYESWLWQDPFGFDSSEYVQKDQYYIEYNHAENNGAENKKSQWFKHRKKLDLEGDNYSKAGDGLCTDQFKKKLGEQSHNLKILLSLVNVRPNTVENKETRIRHRYAVIAGLMESGYYPSHPDRLNFCASQKASNNSHRKFDVRWEHFSNESKENIIVAWVDSNTFNFDSVTKYEDAIKFLERIKCILQDANKCSNNENDLYLFDWTNTTDVTDRFVSGSTNDCNCDKKCNDEDTTKYCLTEKFNRSIKDIVIRPVAVNRATACNQQPCEHNPQTSADKLVSNLVEELKNRRNLKPSEIAIITEQDSDVVRSLAQAFKNSFEKPENQQTAEPSGDSNATHNSKNNTQCSKAHIRKGETCEITTFSYFKGLDAHQQIIDKPGQNKDYQAARQWDNRLSVTDLHNPPVGATQFDYLHRIAREIRQTHDVIDLEKRMAGIKAVGIFGSDFYDKLLILKALRTEMPNLLVFTTNLDAQMLHPQHWRWTRNLVVASPFDLRLNKECHQKLFPTFRDSQQTEIFYRTVYILQSGKGSSGNGQVCENLLSSGIKNVPPLIFEIGRNGPVHLLLSEEDTETTIHPINNSLEQSHFQIKLFFGIALALILIVASVRPHSGALVGWLLLSSAAIFALALAVALADVTSEPFSFTNGTSLWPTIFIQMIVIFLVIAFFVKGLFMLESNFARLNKQYFKNRSDLVTWWSDQEPKSIRSIFKVNQSNKPQQGSASKETKTWPFYSLAIFLIFASGVFYAFNDADPEGFFSFIVCLALLTALVIICVCIEYARPHTIKSIIFWAETDSYYQQSKLKFDFANVIVGLLILFVSISIIFYVPPDLEQIDAEIWPDVIFWLAVIIVTVIIIYISIEIIDRYPPDITAQDKDAQKFITLQEHDGKSGLWQEYYQHGRFDQILLRIAMMWLFFAIIETILFYLLPPWPSPCRGASCDWIQWIGIVGFICTMLLTFFVLDAVRLNYYFIRKLRTKHPLLLDDMTVLNTDGLAQKEIRKFYHERKDNPLETLEKIVTLVAERTLVADKLIYYPLLCIMLMLFARITYFDNQDFPLSKAITFSAGISLLIFSGFMIRYEAQKLKQAAVMSAENLVGNIDPDSHHCVRKLKEISDGIFQPMLEQPVMRALLLILASVGLFAGEYLMLAGF